MHDAPPPLNALRAFEAAARHLSLTKAALELNVTPRALSHQICGLEDHLGLKLFDRGLRKNASIQRMAANSGPMPLMLSNIVTGAGVGASALAAANSVVLPGLY